MKEFVYFFKHINVDGVKIGLTSGESVERRFNQFKTFSPYGAKILGFYECQNCVIEEKRLHEKYKSLRMNGEFFNITEKEVEAELSEQIPNYGLLVSEINLHGLNLSILKMEIERRKEINKPKLKDSVFDDFYRQLENEFTKYQANALSKSMGLHERYFEICLRSKSKSIYFTKTGFGMYKKTA